MTGARAITDPRVERFLTELMALTVVQWTTVGRRFCDREEAIRTAVEEAADLTMKIVTGKVISEGTQTKEERRKAMKVANERAAAATGGLPETVMIGAEAFPLRRLATEATWHAMRGLLVHEELLLREGGRAVLGTLLMPFAGFVTPP
jgi:hypothetical protein